MITLNINWSVLTPILVGVAALIIGYLIALLDRRAPRTPPKSEGGEVQVVEKIAPEPSALSISLDTAGKPLTVRVDGVEVTGSTITPEQRQRMIGLLTLIRPLLEGKPGPVSPAPAPVTPPARPASVPAAKPEAPAGMSMIEQIDAILQDKIAGTPLAERVIYLTKSPGGGVLVNVGNNRYEGVNEVPDPEIKAALREAITEWERKFTPGL